MIQSNWFRSQRTYRAALAVERAFETFERHSATDRHIAVELTMLELAAGLMDKTGLLNEARALRYRIRALQPIEEKSRLEAAARREKARWRRERAETTSAPASDAPPVAEAARSAEAAAASTFGPSVAVADDVALHRQRRGARQATTGHTVDS